MLRDDISAALKESMKAKNARAVSTLRLILAAIKDRDIAARGEGNADGIGDDEVMRVLQTMVKQRQESIKLYEQGGRQDLVDQESAEIDIIRSFLPAPMSTDEIAVAVDAAIGELGAASIKDMGRTMAHLREHYAGRMDFGRASGLLKERLAG
ncbi:MAG: GatB/YqeY domain-containing protein [Alphaproteobacteria bacterium]|nr:GatB/YqeY domain-containing protein [Alphaproteobacteria bacterium]